MGLHSMDDQWWDALIDFRQSHIALAVFQNILRNGIGTAPILQGVGLAAEFEVNLTAVGNLSLRLERVLLGWRLGNKWVWPYCA